MTEACNVTINVVDKESRIVIDSFTYLNNNDKASAQELIKQMEARARHGVGFVISRIIKV